jgi:hypothetical protein
MGLLSGSSQFLHAMRGLESTLDLKEQIKTTLEGNPDRPWCVHRLYEELAPRASSRGRDEMLEVTRRAADDLVMEGQACREFVSATAIGIQCEDALYWSRQSGKKVLAEFGPEYESPTILRRLGSHIQCRGL